MRRQTFNNMLFSEFNVDNYGEIVKKIYGSQIFSEKEIVNKFNDLFKQIDKKLAHNKDKDGVYSYLVKETYNIKQLSTKPSSLKNFHRYLLKKVNTYIEENKLEIIQKSIIVNGERKQRRVDSLARLLAVDYKNNPCVAVALTDKELVVALNSLHPSNTEKEIKQQANYIINKFRLIRAFVLKSAKPKEKLIEVKNNKIIFTEEGKKQALEIARKLQEEDNGGSDIALIKNSTKYDTLDKLLQKDLLKLANSYYLSKRYEGVNGEFSSNQLKALEARQIVLLTSDFKKNQGSLHAEQAIALYIKKNAPHSLIYIGISKLCCGTCTKVLETHKGILSYRGSHGQYYPNVLDIVTKQIHSPIPTKAENHYPDDSDSDEEREIAKNKTSQHTLDSDFNLPSPLERPTIMQLSQAVHTLFPSEHANENCKQNEESLKEVEYSTHLVSWTTIVT